MWFSGQVVQILDYLGVDIKALTFLLMPKIRQGIKDYSNWPTIPQLYIKGEFVGGCDIVREVSSLANFRRIFRIRVIAVPRRRLIGLCR